MSDSKSRSRGRVLPTIPAGGGGARRGVTFNSETIETSIGGTRTPGSLRVDPLSPMNRLSNGDSSLSFQDLSDRLDKSPGILKQATVSSAGNKNQQMLEENSISDTSGNDVSVEISVTQDVTTNGESDKENNPNHLHLQLEGVNSERTPVKVVANHNGHNISPYPSAEKNLLNNVQVYSPTCSPRMKMFQGTPRRHTLDEKLLGTPECYNVVQLEKTRYDFGFDVQSSGDNEDSCSVTVAVRVRPYSQRELSDLNVQNVVSIYGNETTVKSSVGATHRFAYDFSFNSFDRGDPAFASQEHVYASLAQPLLGKAFEGYNTCLFAYGQTGSGKSYTIMGHGEEVGIIPRFCEELFSRAEVAKDLDQVKIHVEISFFEIYNEKIHDLLASTTKEKDKGAKKTTLRVREHPTLGPYVEGLSTFVVNSFDDVKGWITLGNKNRATAATGMNDKSSRSHSVFTMVLTQTKTEILEGQEHDHSITSKINLVDLAGSERQSQAQTSGERLREGANINKSLLTLGKVISQLAEQSAIANKRKKIFIPYRDSVLTWLLKESLGGNSKTAMIATVSPASHHVEETLSTLRYAQTARSIVNIARVNEDPKARLIRELRAEIERLRASGLSGNEDVMLASRAEILSLKDQLQQKEREVEEITKSWQERLRQAEQRKMAEAKSLEKAGVTLKVDNRLPNLVNLNEDPQLSEVLLYVVREGVTKVGRKGSNGKHEIQLNGALIADNHCIISNIETVVSITPIGDAPTYVNGNLISDPTTLHHGDRVILGGDHYFRFNHPMEVQKNKKDKGGSQSHEMKDFEFAKAELMRVQEARLQEAREAAQEEMLEEVERAKKDAEMRLASMEKTMREENEEKVKEAEGVIQKLKKQKMMLEQEVIANRKRQQLEAEASLKATNQLVQERSRILDLLQEEKEQAAQKLEELRSRRNNNIARRIRSPTPTMSPPGVEATSSKMDLYKIALQIREANKISQYMKKHTVFNREDYLDGEEVRTVIKVTNSRLNVCTHWGLAKFEEKLMQMRDLYQNDSESSADEDDDVFNDPEDQWGKDDQPLTPISPKNGTRKSVPSPSLRQALLSSVSSMNSSLVRQDSIGGKGDNIKYPAVASLCKDLVNAECSDFKASSLEESVSDKILHNCLALKRCLTYAARLPVATETTTTTTSTSSSMPPGTSQCRTEVLSLSCLQLTTGYQLLRNNVAVLSSMYAGLRSALIHNLMAKMVDQVKVTGGHVVRFLQGCEADIDSLLEEASSRLHDCLHVMCKLVGELALATDTVMLFFEEETPASSDDTESVVGEVCRSFFSGCEMFIDKTLQGALTTVEDLEARTQLVCENTQEQLQFGTFPQNLEISVATCRGLLLVCQEIQVELDTSLVEASLFTPVSFCSGNYRRSQEIISHVSSLVEAVGLLVQNSEIVVEGREFDIRKLIKCADVIKVCSEKLTSVCGHEFNKLRRRASEANNNEDDTSLLSNTHISQLDYACREIVEAMSSLIESVQGIVELDRNCSVSTPRGKRLLPSQPVGTPLNRFSVKKTSED